MNPTVIFGVFALLFGLYTAVIRFSNPEKLGKLAAMQKAFGKEVGTGVHIIAYTVVPIVVGCVLLFRGLGG